MPRPKAPSAPAATIADVARHAGVAPMTVSRVLNHVPNVRERTRQRVMASVAALRYVPNLAARRLAGAEQLRIGLLYDRGSAGYHSQFIVGLLEQASLSQVQLVVEAFTGDTDELERAQHLLDAGVQGVILPPPLSDSLPLLRLLRRRDVPAVQVATGKRSTGFSAVSVDDERAAAEMTRHVLSLGHRRIGFIAGNPVQSASVNRLAGFRAAMAEAGLAVDDTLVAPGMFSYRSGLDAAERLLALRPRPTAIFASNDDMAAATVAVAHRLGLAVPGDLSVVGFDDTPIATTIWPELTTVRQPVAEMAQRALLMLLNRLQARRNGAADDGGGQHERMDFELVRRQSDAPPRTRPAALPARRR